MTLSRRWPLAIALALATAASVVACGSDPFNSVGSKLPLDVHQDFLALPESLVGTVREVVVTPEESQPLVSREILYLGSRVSAGVHATPLLRFDFSSAPDTLTNPNVFALWKNVELQMKVLKQDGAHGTRTIALYALADTLTDAMADQPLASILGDSLQRRADIGPGTEFTMALRPDLVRAWINARTHTGLALVDRTASPDTNLVGIAAKEFVHYSLLALENAQETIVPEISLQLDTPDQPTFAFPVVKDITNFAVPHPADRLFIAGHLPQRTWLDFDLSGIDPTSTINQALLVLTLDTLQTVGSGRVSFAAHRCTEAEATTENLASLEEVLNSGKSFDLVTQHKIQLDVTEFVQRKVNGVLRPGDGLLLGLDSEVLEFIRLVPYASSVAVDSLRPRILLQVTPPAVYQP